MDALIFEWMKNNMSHAICIMGHDRTGPRFGNQLNSSCVETPMLRVFNYTCNSKTAEYTMADFKDATKMSGAFPGSISWSGWYNLLKAKGYNDTSKLCIFQPGVQILDNWGWCSGSCPGDIGADKRGGCYEGEKDGEDHCTSSLLDKSRFISFSNIVVVAP